MPTPTIRLRCLLLLLALCALPLTVSTKANPASGSQDQPDVPQKIVDDITPLNAFNAETSYVGESGFEIRRDRGIDGARPGSYGRQDETHEDFEYTRRFHLVDRLYLKLGADYERFDFGTTAAPLPTSLQSITATVALEYVVQGHTALYIHSSPGVYYSDLHDVSTGNFDFQTSIGGIVPLGKSIFLLVGARFSLLAHEPVYPVFGVVWLLRDHLRLEAVPPEPRLIYSLSDKIDFFVGGELIGGAYKRDSTAYTRPGEKRFSGGVIDFSEERVGGGVTYSPIKQVDIDFSGGWDLGRDFDYYRGAGKRFVTYGAPYAKIKISAEF